MPGAGSTTGSPRAAAGRKTAARGAGRAGGKTTKKAGRKKKTLRSAAAPPAKPADSAEEAALRRRAGRITRQLAKDYPGAECALTHESALQLLIATILSAQCTDRRVNQVTPGLFARYPDAAAFAESDPDELETLIHSTGFFRNKARSIRGACRRITEEHRGEVPDTMESLLALPGVARKTANVVLGTWFGKAEGVVVDTHVFRISHRLGLTAGQNPAQTERRLMELLPRPEWIDYSHRVIHHGRAVCLARNPKCRECSLEAMCPRLGVPDPDAAAPPKPRTPRKPT